MVKKQGALTRFRCGHCGSRLVMQSRHLDRLAACHACGRATHPLAGRLAQAADAPGKSVNETPAKPAAKTAAKARAGVVGPACANCGDSLGKLQTRRLWHEATVCQPCYTKLAAEIHGSAPVARAAASPAAGAKPAAPPVDLPPRVAPAPAGDVPVLEFSAAPLAPVLLVGAACLGFFFALSVMSYVGGLVLALALVFGAVVGLRWLRRGTSSVRARLEQISTLRRQHGTPRVIAMLLAWFRAQPAKRLPYALFLLLIWGAMYVPYRLSNLLYASRPASAARLSA